MDDYVSGRDQWAFYLTLVVGAILLFCVWLIARSRFGRALIAVRDHEAAAETVGINLPRVKVMAFALSALYAGTAGSLSILVTRVANAGKVETFQLSIEFLVALVIAPAVRGFLVGAHRSAEPGHRPVLEALGLEPLLELELRLGEGSGAALALPVVAAARDVLVEMATFDHAGVTDTGR